MARPKRIPQKPAKEAGAPTTSLSAIPPRISSPGSKRSAATSDDSDGLVTTRAGTVKTKNPLYQMSGAAAIEDVIQDGKRLKPIRGRQRKELNRIAREDAATTAAIEAMRKRMEGKVPEQNASEAPVVQQGTRTTTSTRPPATLQVQASQPALELEDEGVRPVPGSAWKRASAVPMSVRKPISTPRSDAMMMSVSRFRPRPRAPSILGIGNDDETASISSAGSFGDLIPDDESTPLPKMRAQGTRKAMQTVSPPSFGDHDARTSSSRKRKRGSADLHVPNSQPDETVQPPLSSPPREFEASWHRSSSPLSDAPLPELPTETPNQSSHTPPSSTMAPPASSSPTKADSKDVSRRSSSPLAGRRAKKSAAGPGVAKTWTRKRTAKTSSAPVDTAALQGLLPRRRHRAVDSEFSIFDSEGPAVGSDDDELSYAPSKKRATSRSRQPLGDRKTMAGNAKKPGKGSKTANKNVTPLKNGARTYSRRQSEQENEVTISSDDDQTSGEEDNAQSKRSKPSKQSDNMKAMAEKFAEVDDWEMEYEEVTGSSDTFKNAR